MEQSCQQEINDLHQFFEDWFAGKLPNEATQFERVRQALAADFILVSPNGRLTPRDPLLAGLQAEHNGRSQFHIWIKNYQLRQQWGNVALVTYEEWQTLGDQTTTRLSTALFRQNHTAPNGVEWLHVHETWIE